MSEVVLEDVVKAYGDVVAVDHVSFTIKDGEFIALVGRLAVARRPRSTWSLGWSSLTSGTITSAARWSTIWTRRIATSRWFSRITRCTRAKPSPEPGVPTADAQGTQARDRSARQTCRRDVEHHPLAAAQAAPAIRRQQQRVALGRALVRDPKAFLMDERCRTWTPCCASRCDLS